MTAPLDLEAIKAEFLNQCGPCDFGMPTVCTCPKGDYRPAMLALVREVDRLRVLISDVAAKFEANADLQSDAANQIGMLALALNLRKAVML